MRKKDLGEIDAIDPAEELEIVECDQVYKLRFCYRKICRDLLNLVSSHPSSMEAAEDPGIVQQREVIAQLLATNPSLTCLREDLFGQAYEDERRRLAAETNIAIANAKFPNVPPFSVDEAESQFFWPTGRRPGDYLKPTAAEPVFDVDVQVASLQPIKGKK